MRAMRCDRAAELIGAYLDQELNPEDRREIAAHLDACPACSALADDIRHIGGKVAALGRELAPEDLEDRVRSRLASAEAEPVDRPRLAARSGRLTQSWQRQAAVLLLACGVTAAVTALLTSRIDATAALERDVAVAHVRSLLQESPVQVASSDTHAIKPWFAGRLDFAPNVRDLATEGYTLTGARLDFVGDRRVAAIVYRRRLHVVNVFLWPSAVDMDSTPRAIAHRGYNVITWSKAGIVHWAISDLNMAELRQLAALL